MGARFLVVTAVTAVLVAGTVAGATPRRRPRRDAELRMRVAEALFVEGMRRWFHSGCGEALPAFEQALAERPGGRQQLVIRRWVIRCRAETGARPADAWRPIDPYAAEDPYAELDGPPRVVVVPPRDPYDDLDSPPRRRRPLRVARPAPPLPEDPYAELDGPPRAVVPLDDEPALE